MNLNFVPPHQFYPLHSLLGRLRWRGYVGVRPWDRLSDQCERCYLPRISHPVVSTVPARSKHRRGLTTSDTEQSDA